jgi:hypothetical protein
MLVFVFVLIAFKSEHHTSFHKIKGETHCMYLCNADMPVVENGDECSNEKKCNKKDCLTGCAATFREAMEEVKEIILNHIVNLLECIMESRYFCQGEEEEGGEGGGERGRVEGDPETGQEFLRGQTRHCRGPRASGGRLQKGQGVCQFSVVWSNLSISNMAPVMYVHYYVTKLALPKLKFKRKVNFN